MKKIRWLTVFNTVVISATALVAMSCSQEDYLVGRGSNSVLPLIRLISTHTIYNTSYSPDGSTFGAREMAKYNVSVDFGAVSSRKAPGTLGGVPGIDYSDKAQGLEQERINWYNNNVRTVTFAIDAIGIGLNLPASFINALAGQAPITDFDSLAKIYSFRSDNPEFVYPKWKDFLKNPEIQTLPEAEQQPIPLAIEGGVSTSGKAEAFIDKIMKDSQWFKDNKSKLDVDAIKNHTIIPEENKVADRDQEIYSKNNGTAGSVMYYSLGYLLKNTGKDSVIITKIENNGTLWGDPTIANAQSKAYPWIRPFNLIYQTTNQTMIKLVDLILTARAQEGQSQTFQDLIEQNGYVYLSNQQIDLQKKDHQLTDPDQEMNQDPNFDYGLKL